jgi:large subunit ribosomal protein L10
VPIRLADKQVMVAEVAEIATKATSVLAADYRGLTVGEMTELRKKAREHQVQIRVVRNTLARRAFTGTDFACMDSALVGPLFLAFSLEGPGAAARIIRDFLKEHENLAVKAIALGGKLHDGKQLDKIANLPTKLEAISQLMSVLQAPITKFVRTLAEPHGKLVRTLAAVRDQKKAAS